MLHWKSRIPVNTEIKHKNANLSSNKVNECTDCKTLPVIPARPNVVTMVVNAGLGETAPRANIVPRPPVYLTAVLKVLTLGSTGGGGAIPGALGLASTGASSCGGGAGGKISPWKTIYHVLIQTGYHCLLFVSNQCEGYLW